jgi:hypothetical protein
MHTRLVVVGILAVALGLGRATQAATIVLDEHSDGKRPTIWIRGTIEQGDERRFVEIATCTVDPVVRLESSGGLTAPAVAIGRIINAFSFTTSVDNAKCTSACALIWLAGSPRILGPNGRIGFHASYAMDGDTHEITAPGNAVAGAYMRGLGLPDSFIRFATTAPPDEMNWLTKTAADVLGLSYWRDLSDKNSRNQHNRAVAAVHDQPQDLRRAVESYRSAATAGFAGSQNNLGDLYETGTGVKQNDRFAIYWYARAAERGEPTAYLSLSSLLAKDTDDHDMLVEALKFAILAERKLRPGKNHLAAKDNIENLTRRLIETDIFRARAAAESWEPLYQERRLMGDTLRQ